MENTKKMSLAVMSTELSLSEMEMIQAGSGGWGCAAAWFTYVGVCATAGALTFGVGCLVAGSACWVMASCT
jgi:hypothetical protein